MHDPRAPRDQNESALTIERGPMPDALAAAFQHAMVGIAIAGPDGRLRDGNPALLRMLGYQRHELLALHIADITHADDQEADAAQRARLEDGEVDAYQREKRYVRKDGTALWGLVTVSALRDEAGEYLGSSAQIQDISAQKVAESALRENEAQLEALVGQLPVVLYSQPWGGSHAIQYVSPQFERQTGLGRDDVPDNFAKLLMRCHPDDRAHILAVNERSDRTGETAQAVYRIRGGNGDWVWLDHHSVLMRDEHGQPLAWHGSMLDISERKRLESSLRESEVRFRRAFEDAAIGMAIGTTDDICLDANEAYCAIVGISREELIGRSFQEFTYPDDRAGQTERLAQLMAGEIDSVVDEKRYIRPDGALVTALATVSAVRDETGALLYCIGQIQDITAQKASEAALRESEELLRSIVERAPAAVYRMEPGIPGRFTYASPHFRTLSGLSIADNITKTGDFFPRVHPDDLPLLLGAEREAARTGEAFDAEYRLRGDDGAWVWVHDRSSPARDEQGQIIAWHGVLLDISERKRLQEALRENETRLQVLVEQLPAALFSLEPGSLTRYAYVSPQFGALTGMSPDDVARGTEALFERIHSEDVDRVRESDRRTHDTGQTHEIEYRVSRADGEWVWLQERAMLARDSDGRPLAWHGVLLDISKQRQAEAALSESAQHGQALIASALDAVLEMDRAGRIIEFNPAAERVFGYGREEAMGRSLADLIIPPDAREQHRNGLARYVATGEGPILGKRQEMTAQRADGTAFPAELSVTPLTGGHYPKFVGFVRDISDRIAIESALRESEALFRSTFEGAGVGMALCDPDCRVRFANPALERLLGFEPSELDGQDSDLLTHPDDLKRHMAYRQRMQAGEIDSYQLEKRYARKDGQYVWVILNVTGIRDDRGALRSVIGQLQDITARKEAEEALRQSEARFRSTFEGAGIGMSLADLHGRFFDANPAFCEFLGYTRDELLTLTYLEITHPDDREFSLDYTQRLFADGSLSFSTEKRYVRADGRTVWGQLTITTVSDSRGTPYYEIAQVQDITARKEAESALRESEERFRSTFERAGIGMTLVDLHGRFLDANPAFCQFIGYSRDELLNLTSLDITHPDDRPVSEESIYQVDEGQVDTFSIEKRYQRPDGHVVWGDVTVTAMRGSDGQVEMMIGQVQDITARKEAEAARRESEERFQSIFEDAGIGMALITPNSTIALANPAFGKFLGYTSEELIGLQLTDFTYAEDLAVQEPFRQRVRRGEIDAYQMEKRYVRKDGVVVWGLLNVSAIRDESGTLHTLIGQVQDISARKEAEAALRDSEARFRALVQNDPDVIVIVDEAMTVTYVSPSSRAVFGTASAEGETTVEANLHRVHPEDLERLRALLGDIREQPGAVASTESRIRHDDKSWRWFQVTCVNLLADPGVRGYLFNLRDITDGKRAEIATATALKTQQAAIAELERLNRSKSRFLSTISHEFRTPLTAIIGYSEFMANNADNPELIVDDAEVIHREASRLNRMVDDVLLLDRVDARHISLNLEAVALNAVVEDVVETFRPLIHQHQFALDLDPALRVIEGDRDRLAQALTNLVSNAVKYSPAGGTVAIATQNVDDGVLVSVRDEGIGIAADDQSRIFERFERIETGIAGRIAGTGLGLSIVKEITNLHGGSIWFESELGYGSTFSLTLPYRPPAQATPAE